MSRDKDSLSDMQNDASQEASERSDAESAMREHQSSAGDDPDTHEQSDQARQDADWDAAEEHADSGGTFTK